MSRVHRLSMDDLPELPGYVTVATLAQKYDVSKETVYHLIFVKRQLTKCFKVSDGMKERPLILVEKAQGDEVLQRRAQELGRDKRLSAGSPEKIRQWNRRVKQWGRDTNWTLTEIRVSGQPGKELQEAYLAEHPDDPRPA